ncbi:MAG TPA: hypothetical protein VFX69_12795 [Steroidobacteraceae bacterium]|jgi:hypothetical protein|nr:hypothetical protein [Steroidobacteraceae bacterium]
MRIRKHALGALAAVLAFGTLGSLASAADRPYTEGPVLDVAAIRTQPGMFDAYLKYLAGPYKQVMEEQKKAGIILSWNVYQTNPRGPDDPDIYLVTVYKNMAAMDGLNDKTDPITEKVWGSMDKSNEAMVKRSEMRTILGNEVIRELVPK